MHLKKLKIQNFRAIENVEVEFDSLVSVIIGPNAIGKTTVLEAIRAAKALLAPRTQHEANQFLNSLSVTSPHIPQMLFPNALTNRPEIPLVVKSSYSLQPGELETISRRLPQLASAYAQQSVGINPSNPSQAISFLSSPQGKALLLSSETELREELEAITRTGNVELNLTIDFASANISGEFPIQHLFAAALDQSLPPSKTIFSYFPADRALPLGEQPVQLGLADINQQLESYNSQPQLKYTRLKHTIFNSIIAGDSGRSEIEAQFGLIFEKILRGRELGEIGINALGMLSIPVIDKETGHSFEIDSLSSGEKGLILTFLLIARSMERNGILLLDEPELHLNPAVCRDLLQFLVDQYATKMNVQAVVCSHSAEILAGAFEHSSCSLYHLRGSTTLAKVRHQDQGEIRDALRRLGSSESEALLYRGTVSVEGIHDVETLRVGFDDLLRRYRIRQRGGRGQVEKDIEELQKAEAADEDIGNHFFVFDHDRKPTNLRNSKHVRLLQLGRFCLENYLIDVDILTDLSRDKELSLKPQANTTDTLSIVKSLAMQQLSEVVARAAFSELGLEAVCFDMDALRANSSADIAAAIWSQIQSIEAQFRSYSGGFEIQFQNVYTERYAEKVTLWDQKWRELCDGKRLFEALRNEQWFRGDLQRLKRRVILEMRNSKTETWSSLNSQLTELVTLR